MKNLKRTIWGIVLVIAAVILALNSFGLINFDLFFDGWWTLFIIIPSFVGLIQDRNKSGSVFGLCIGILLLLSAQEIISWDMIWKIAFPLVIAIVGLKMIFSSFKKDKTDRIIKEIKKEGKNLQQGTAVFCGTEMDFDNVVFEGADLTAVFGGIDCDLRNAIIDRDCVIKVCCAFGGIDILVPDNVKIVTNTTSVFGGVEVIKNNNSSATHTIYIEGLCTFGGVDIK
ncbi:MAG: hypothetical protein IKA84_03230 [Clostridia bacterium]|nr:hypothetical protein [Clostridia bacterium]